MIKIRDTHQYMTITSNGFIILYDDFPSNEFYHVLTNIRAATILSSELIFVQKTCVSKTTNMNTLYHDDMGNGVISTTLLPLAIFEMLERNCKKDLMDYHYIKKDYIYKIPNNNLILCKHLFTKGSKFKNHLMLCYHLLNLYLIKDCLPLIIPDLLTLIRLDYS